MKYHVIIAKSPDELEKAVQLLLDKDWRLAGSLQVVTGSSGRDTFYQSMTLSGLTPTK